MFCAADVSPTSENHVEGLCCISGSAVCWPLPQHFELTESDPIQRVQTLHDNIIKSSLCASSETSFSPIKHIFASTMPSLPNDGIYKIENIGAPAQTKFLGVGKDDAIMLKPDSTDQKLRVWPYSMDNFLDSHLSFIVVPQRSVSRTQGGRNSINNRTKILRPP